MQWVIFAAPATPPGKPAVNARCVHTRSSALPTNQAATPGVHQGGNGPECSIEVVGVVGCPLAEGACRHSGNLLHSGRYGAWFGHHVGVPVEYGINDRAG